MCSGASMVWHPSLPLINSLNNPEAAIFPCKLCFLRTFPFFILITTRSFYYIIGSSISLTCRLSSSTRPTTSIKRAMSAWRRMYVTSTNIPSTRSMFRWCPSTEASGVKNRSLRPPQTRVVSCHRQKRNNCLCVQQFLVYLCISNQVANLFTTFFKILESFCIYCLTS